MTIKSRIIYKVCRLRGLVRIKKKSIPRVAIFFGETFDIVERGKNWAGVGWREDLAARNMRCSVKKLEFSERRRFDVQVASETGGHRNSDAERAFVGKERHSCVKYDVDGNDDKHLQQQQRQP